MFALAGRPGLEEERARMERRMKERERVVVR
jgi:hypothetical protein